METSLFTRAAGLRTEATLKTSYTLIDMASPLRPLYRYLLQGLPLPTNACLNLGAGVNFCDNPYTIITIIIHAPTTATEPSLLPPQGTLGTTICSLPHPSGKPLASCTPRLSLRVQVPNNHILTQNLYYNHYYPKPKYLIIGYLDPLAFRSRIRPTPRARILEANHGLVATGGEVVLILKELRDPPSHPLKAVLG